MDDYFINNLLLQKVFFMKKRIFEIIDMNKENCMALKDVAHNCFVFLYDKLS